MANGEDTSQVQQIQGLDNPVNQQALGAATELVTTGSSSLPSDVLGDVAAIERNQTLSYRGATFADLVADAEADLPGLREKRLEHIKAATENKPLTSGQALAAAILQIAPILIGLGVSGSKGGAIGAQAGLTGTKNLFAGIEAQNERDRLRAAAELEGVEGDIEDREDLISKLKIEDVKESRKDARTVVGAAADIQRAKADKAIADSQKAAFDALGKKLDAGRFKEADNDVRKQIQEVESVNETVADLIQAIDAGVASGDLDPNESFLGADLRAIKSGILQKGKAADLERRKKRILIDLVKAVSGAQVNEKEFDRITESRGLNPDSPISALRDALVQASNEATRRANIGVDQIERAGGRFPFGRGRTVDQILSERRSGKQGTFSFLIDGERTDITPKEAAERARKGAVVEQLFPNGLRRVLELK